MNKTHVAGIFLERDGAHLLHSIAEKSSLHGPWDLEFIDQMVVKWDSTNPDEARAGISKLGDMIGDIGSELKSVAVASYGPFLSLNKDSNQYGTLHPSTADSPLTGFDLKEQLNNSLLRQGVGATSGPKLTFHTDADACALGEAFERKIPNNYILGFLFVTEGIGLGWVRGQEILRSALHPEIGLIHTRLMPNDPLVLNRSHIQYTETLESSEKELLYGGGLEQYAANKSLYERYSALTNKRSPELKDIIDYRDDDLWNFRAYYIAQACFACTTIFPPHYLAIGASIDPKNDIGIRVRCMFNEFMTERLNSEQSVFEYDALSNENFISNSVISNEDSTINKVGYVGVVGMCCAAASENLLGDVKKI